jgi:ATP-dependent Clp protease ATP-binding subunit ClpC
MLQVFGPRLIQALVSRDYGMFERFTETARRTLYFARHETTELGGTTIEAEHILLGLLRADKGPTPHCFAVADLSYTDARARIRAHWGVRQHLPSSVELPFSDETRRILQYAKTEADRLGHRYIGTGHLLLGVLGEEGSFAAGMLRGHGMTLEHLREYIVKPSGVPEPEPEGAPAGNGVWVKHGEFDALETLERIRWLAEELGRSQTHVDDSRSLVDEIHHHVDTLKRHLA